MIVRFFDHHGAASRGAGHRAVDYLVNEVDPVSKERRDVTPEVIHGDPERIERLIDSLPFKHSYKSGVLSWEPGEVVTPEQEAEAMKRFEGVAFAGLDRDRYEILWVRHAHAGHHELHFITPRVELATGKSLNIDPPTKNSQRAYDLMREAYNLEFGFSDPQDPAHRRELQLPDHVHLQMSQAKKMKLELGEDPRRSIHGYLDGLIEAGMVKDRADIVKALKEAGLQVPRQGEKYLTVLDPQSNERVRLKGSIYEREWERKELSRAHEREGGGEQPRLSPSSGRSLGELQSELAKLVQKRALYHRGRYQERERGVEKKLDSALQIEQGEPALSRARDLARSGSDEWAPQLVPVFEDSIAKGRALESAGTRGQEQARVLGSDSSAARAVRERQEREPLGIERTARADRSQQERARHAAGGPEEGRSLPADGGNAVGGSDWDGPQNGRRQVLGGSSAVKEAYDRIRESALGLCREIGERVERTRAAVARGLECIREAYERIGEVTQSLLRSAKRDHEHLQRSPELVRGLQQEIERTQKKSLALGLGR